MTAVPTPLALPNDLLTGVEWNGAQIAEMFRLTADIKERPSSYSGSMSGRFIALIMEKPSLRTSMTFQIGMQSMGGSAILLDHTVSRLGDRESVPDMARNLSRWVQGIVARVFEQQKLEQLAEYASIPVINALSNRFHPCQAYADFFTLQEHFGSGNLRGLKLAYVGDGNNVCHSLMTVGALLGARIRVGTPKGYEPSAEILAETRRIAVGCGGTIELFDTAEEAVAGAQAIYTDVWASMGQEAEEETREKVFAPFQVNARLVESAAPGAVFLHCLPAHRGAEVTDAVMDSARSMVFDQAENRLHVQKAILLMLIR
jgi:ornithine carbamoyltransferase